MTFLNPWLLLAALGVGLPILAHLFNRYRVKRTDWAAMAFLNRSVRIRSRQMRLRDILLLILRCLAVLLLVLAVSRPGAKRAEGVAARFGEPRAGVIFALDVSYSMLHGTSGSTRFERALQQIEEIAATLPPESPVSLVLLGNEHRVVARNMAYREEQFNDLLRAQQASPETLRLETVPGVLAELASDMDALQKEIYILTDLQAGDWDVPSPWLPDALTELNKLAPTFLVPIPGTPENLSITDFELFSGRLRKGTVARYRATVRNHGPTPVNQVRVSCLVNGMNVDGKVIPTIGAGSSETVSFFVPFHNAGSAKLTARLEPDALPLDNVRRTVTHIRERVSILCVEGHPHGNSLESYVVKALQAQGRDAGNEDLRVRSVSWLSLPSQNLKAYDVVVLSDVPEITVKQANQLRDYVREGNGLIWFGGDNLKVAEWNERSGLENGALLPARIGPMERVSDAQGAGRPLDPELPDHPVCRPLRSLPKDLLSETQFHRLLNVTPLPGSSAILNLSGSPTPILVEHGIGRGHVFMFTTSSNPSWNNLALTPVFPMLLQQMVTYLTGREFEKPQLVNGSLSLSYPDRPDANDGVFETPSGDLIKVPVREHGGRYVAFLDQAREAGFYLARVSVQAPGHPMAVNVDTRESDVRCLEVEQVRNRLAGTGVTVSESPTQLIAETRTGHEYGRALLTAGLVILLLEGLFASGLFGRRKASAGGASQASVAGEGA